MEKSLEQTITRNEQVDELIEETLSNKLRRIAQTLRNNQGLFQIQNQVYGGDNMVCATGLLALRAGVEKSQLNSYQYKESKVIKNYYGITQEENERGYDYPYRNWDRFLTKKASLAKVIFGLNDHGWSFNRIADYIDSLALKLESSQ